MIIKTIFLKFLLHQLLKQFSFCDILNLDTIFHLGTGAIQRLSREEMKCRRQPGTSPTLDKLEGLLSIKTIKIIEMHSFL